MARKTAAASSDPPELSMSLREYITQAVNGHTLTSLSMASKVPYSTLYRHVVQGLEISPKNARRLQEWSEGKISAAKTLGV